MSKKLINGLWQKFVKEHIKKYGIGGKGFLSVKDRKMFEAGSNAILEIQIVKINGKNYIKC